MPLVLPLPTDEPANDIAQYVPLLLTAIEGFLQDSYYWEAADYDAAYGYMEQLKEYLVGELPPMEQVYPEQAILLHQNSEVVVGNAIVFSAIASTQWGGIWRQTTSAQDNDFKQSVFLRAGTYTISVVGQKNTTCGKLHIYVDGVAKVTQDWYAAAAAMATIASASITISGDGQHVVECQVQDKNASSAGYDMRLCTFHFKRTGA